MGVCKWHRAEVSHISPWGQKQLDEEKLPRLNMKEEKKGSQIKANWRNEEMIVGELKVIILWNAAFSLIYTLCFMLCYILSFLASNNHMWL
jgi:hypothetical protein